MTATELQLKTKAEPAGRRARRLQRLAALLAVAALVEALAIVTLGLFGDARIPLDADLVTAGFLGIVLLAPIMGALIAQRRPYTRVPWLMIGLGLGLGLGLLTYAYGINGLPPARPLPFALETFAASQLFFLPAIGGTTILLLLLFPTDRFVEPRWRAVAWLAIAGVAIGVVGALVRPGELDAEVAPGILNPIGVPPAWAWVAELATLIANVVLTTCLFLAAVSLVVRYRRADPIEAAQIRWLALVAFLAAAGLALAIVPVEAVSEIGFGLGLVFIACMPIAIGIAITRYRLYEIDRLINRAIVYGSLTAILAGVFTAAVGLAQRLFVVVTNERSDAAIVATTLIVATLYAPLRKRLDEVVDRRFKYEHTRFGSYRDELQTTLSLVDAGAAAERLAREIARETGAADVAVLDAAGVPTAVVGSWPIAGRISIPIPGGHGALSALALGGRAGQASLVARRRPEIEEIAGLAARAVRHPEGR